MIIIAGFLIVFDMLLLIWRNNGMVNNTMIVGHYGSVTGFHFTSKRLRLRFRLRREATTASSSGRAARSLIFLFGSQRLSLSGGIIILNLSLLFTGFSLLFLLADSFQASLLPSLFLFLSCILFFFCGLFILVRQ